MNDRTPGRLKLASAVMPCVDLKLDRLVMAQSSPHSALRMPTNVLVAGAELPMIRATMPFKVAHTALGLINNPFLAAGVVEAYIANVIAGAVDSNSTHIKYAKTTNCTACAWIDSFSVTEGGEVLCEVLIALFSTTGDVDPITRTGSLAFPALSAIPENHGIGIFTANGSALDGITGIGYQSGFQLSVQRTSGHKFITGGVPSGFKQVLTIEHQDADAVFAALGGVGAVIASTTTVTLQKYLNDVLATSGQLTLTMAQGFMHAAPAGGRHGEHFKGGVIVMPSSSDGDTSAIAVA